MGLFSTKKAKIELPKVLTEQEEPVNYNSVLDYLVGLSRGDYDKILKVSGIYRQANKEAAKILGVKDEPTADLLKEKPTEEAIDDALDAALDGNLSFIDEGPVSPKPTKQQSTKPKQIDVK